MTVIGHWRRGEQWAGEAARAGDVYDPATGQVTAQVSFASAEEVDQVVAEAAEAQRAWADTSLARRTSVLFAFREALARRREEIAAVITAQHGKVRDDALGEVQRGLEVADFACGAPHLLKGAFTDAASTGVDVHSMRQPLGVVAVVSPFNFPAMVPLWFVPLAVACGNAVVLKPSEKDPGASLLLGECWAEAGLPPGIFNVVQGDREAVEALLQHPQVAAVSFVGSTPVARHVYETATRHGKRVQALGGAKNHMVVLPDADLAAAADGAVGAGFGSAGERCMAVSVVVAVDPAGDELVERIASRIAALRTGDGRRDCDMGPLVTAAHRDKVASYVNAGLAAGARLVVDGRTVDADGDSGGFWLGPSLFDHVRPGMPVYDEEIFGPVLSVVRVGSLDEALALVDAHPYGNGTAIFTRDGGAARRFAREVAVGMVGVNVPIPVPTAYYSFGGWKASLFGDTHAHGIEGVHFYTRGKVVTSRWPETTPDAGRGDEAGGVQLGFPTSS